MLNHDAYLCDPIDSRYICKKRRYFAHINAHVQCWHGVVFWRQQAAFHLSAWRRSFPALASTCGSTAIFIVIFLVACLRRKQYVYVTRRASSSAPLWRLARDARRENGSARNHRLGVYMSHHVDIMYEHAVAAESVWRRYQCLARRGVSACAIAA